ncbi:MAG: tripartite tricarboxylate transporter TctB family protein [Pseudomonadota bacterium]
MSLDSATADRITAVVLFALGVAMLVGGYTMDRLEIRQIHPASIPGLLPMILGATMMLCATLLFVGAARRARADAVEPAPTDGGESWGRMAATAGLSAVYALVLVGWLPFFVATALYVGLFILIFTWPGSGTSAGKVKVAMIALVFALATAGATSALFRYGFLVRLP